MHRNKFFAALLSIAALTAGCTPFPERPAGTPDDGSIETGDAVPRIESPSRYGNPEHYDVFGHRYYVLKSSRGFTERGIASWYGPDFHGHKTSSGEMYDMYKMTAAHKTLPLPTYVRVTNLRNGKSVIVRVNDRGPFHENRIIDLSYAAAQKLDIVKDGTGLVEVRAIDPAAWLEARQQGEENPPAGNASVDAAATDVAAGGAPDTGQTSVSVTAPQMYLQVGAFAQRDNADRVVARLRDGGIANVQIQESTVSGQTLFKVRVGPMDSVEDADRVTRTLDSMGYPDTHVVIE